MIDMSTSKNLVLDLDSTAIHTNNINDLFENIKIFHRDVHHRVAKFDIADDTNYGINLELWTIYRPYLYEFLNFCSKYFNNVFIWSAGQHKYVHIIKDLIYDKIDKKPEIIYTYDDCILKGNNINKPLSKLFNDDRITNVNFKNTIVIDDRYDTFSLNPHNGILIPAYEPKDINEIKNDKDVSLLQIMGWLSLPEVKNSTDVRNLDKTNIFNITVEEYIKKIKF